MQTFTNPPLEFPFLCIIPFVISLFYGVANGMGPTLMHIAQAVIRLIQSIDNDQTTTKNQMGCSSP